MQPMDFFLLAVVAALACLALRACWKRRGSGCSGCSGCSGACGACRRNAAKPGGPSQREKR